MSLAVVIMLSLGVNAQVKNAKTETFAVKGNCGMCKKTIEKAGNLKDVSEVNWDKDKKQVTIVYDSKKTTADAVLQKIADAGYDNEKFTAKDEVYAKLHGCCKYDRGEKKEK
ncbi:MAG: hypothetical protein E6Q95_04400 [Chitinophagaceae bacterium]|nr:MAG: hypothetical protein E6Q95_04400 [Chitinophagaceae bacterium]